MSAEGSQSSMSFAKEVSWGIIPAVVFTGVNFSEEEMKYIIENKTSNHIRPDRQTTDLIQVGAACEGGFTSEMQAGNLDTLFPGFFMQSGWTLDVLTNGVTRSSYTFERANNDINQFFQYVGMVPNVMEITIEVEEPVAVGMTFVGKKETLTQVTASTGAATDPTENPIIAAGSSIGDILIDDVAVAECLIEKIKISLDNQTEGKKSVSVLGFCDANAKSLMVTGELTMFFEDEQYYDRYLAGTEFKLVVNTFDSLGNTYAIELPRCKFNEGTANVTGRDDSVMEEHSFTALVGDPEGYTIQLTRSII